MKPRSLKNRVTCLRSRVRSFNNSLLFEDQDQKSEKEKGQVFEEQGKMLEI